MMNIVQLHELLSCYWAERHPSQSRYVTMLEKQLEAAFPNVINDFRKLRKDYDHATNIKYFKARCDILTACGYPSLPLNTVKLEFGELRELIPEDHFYFSYICNLIFFQDIETMTVVRLAL